MTHSVTDLNHKATARTIPDLQKVFTTRGRWCCLDGRLTVHKEVRLRACLYFERQLQLHPGRDVPQIPGHLAAGPKRADELSSSVDYGGLGRPLGL